MCIERDLLSDSDFLPCSSFVQICKSGLTVLNKTKSAGIGIWDGLIQALEIMSFDWCVLQNKVVCTVIPCIYLRDVASHLPFQPISKYKFKEVHMQVLDAVFDQMERTCVGRYM